ncbi:MAG: HlyC/CorC family transporter [Chloroflexi bacterium]|nr:HlyC/CorC family transporter [Chloroflexota bacterium]
MSGDSWIGIALVAVALAVAVAATAVETGVVFISRMRVRAFTSRGLPQAESLDDYIRDRYELLGALAIARDLALVLGIATSVFIVLRETDSTWLALAATMTATLLAVAVLGAVPRLVVARSPERWALRLLPVMKALRAVFTPPAAALEWLLSALLRLRDRKDRPAGEEEELLRLADLPGGNGAVENGEMAMIRRIARMVDRAVREIMVPRIDMVAAEADAPVDEVLSLVIQRGFSRIPLYEDTIDNIVGIVHAKDILKVQFDGQRPESLRDVARPPYFIPEGKHIDELLTELREHRVQLAIVVDEYGGTAGLVTIEDVLEEIVGEIQDEYDSEEVTIERVTDDEAIIDARVGLEELNELFSLEIEGEDFDTLGGFVYHQLGRMPAPGDELQADGLNMRVLSVVGRRIKKVRVTKAAVKQEEEGERE